MPIIKITELKSTDKPNDEYVYPPDDTYIPTSKIYFELDSNNNLFSQLSSKNKDEQSFLLNYKFTDIEKSKCKIKK